MTLMKLLNPERALRTVRKMPVILASLLCDVPPEDTAHRPDDAGG